MAAVTEVEPSVTVVARPPWWMHFVYFLYPAVLWLASRPWEPQNRGELTRDPFWVAMAVVVGAFVVASVLQAVRERVEADADGISLVRWRRRHWDWSDVHCLLVGRGRPGELRLVPRQLTSVTILWWSPTRWSRRGRASAAAIVAVAEAAGVPIQQHVLPHQRAWIPGPPRESVDHLPPQPDRLPPPPDLGAVRP